MELSCGLCKSKRKITQLWEHRKRDIRRERVELFLIKKDKRETKQEEERAGFGCEKWTGSEAARKVILVKVFWRRGRKDNGEGQESELNGGAGPPGGTSGRGRVLPRNFTQDGNPDISWLPVISCVLFLLSMVSSKPHSFRALNATVSNMDFLK